MADIYRPSNYSDGNLKIEWSSEEFDEKERRFDVAQIMIDGECIKRCAPYTPIKTGAMYRSPYKNTKIGSGKIVYGVPYDKRQYYNPNYFHSTAIHPYAGAFWFERMKADNAADILSRACKITGGKAE